MSMLGYMMMGENWSLNDALRKWKKYAADLEESLAEHKKALCRQYGIKEAALAEIARLDPDNPLMRQEVRKAIADQAEQEARKSGEL